LKPSFSRPPEWNNLTQNILASFCGISSLEILDLSYNNLSGPNPFLPDGGYLWIQGVKSEKESTSWRAASY
jgi:hypothetical protein